MYIRSRTNHLKNGKQQTSYTLVEGHRVDTNCRSRTLLNLGKDFSIQREHWRSITDEVAHRLRKKEKRVLQNEWHEQTVEDIIKRLKEKNYAIDGPRDNRLRVMVSLLRLDDCRSVGGERLAMHAMAMLGFQKALQSLGWSSRDQKMASILVMGRMLFPGSELKTYQWMLQASVVLEILDLESHPPSLTSLYLTGDLLYEHKNQLIQELFKKAQGLFDFKPMVSFYDLTHVYCTGQQEHSDLKKHGRSQEKRSHCPLVSLALLMDPSGFPVDVQIHEGNVREPKTLKKAVASLGTDKPLVVMDAGISTKENLDFLKSQGLDWIRVLRGQKPAAPQGKPDARMTLEGGTVLKAWSMEKKDGEHLIWVHSSQRQKKEEAILERHRTAFETALIRLHEGLSMPKRMKHYDQVMRKVGRLEKKHSLVACQYQVTVHKDKTSDLATSVTFKQFMGYQQRSETTGIGVIRTSMVDWPLKKVVLQYIQLNDMEQTFRCLKSTLGLRPLHHQIDIRIEAHLWISILAYYVVHCIRKTLRTGDIDSDWSTIRWALSSWQRGSVTLYQTKTKKHKYRMDAQPSMAQGEIANILGMPIKRHLKKWDGVPIDRAMSFLKKPKTKKPNAKEKSTI